MPMNIQETYVEGSIVDLESALTAHHKGHIELRGCAIEYGEVAQQSYFDDNPFVFIEDNLYEATPDANYPERAYLPLASHPKYVKDQGYVHSHKYQLPLGLVGVLILIQWRYVTANTCLLIGYDQYNSLVRPLQRHV